MSRPGKPSVPGTGRCLECHTVEVPAEVFPDLVAEGAGPGRVLWRSPSLALAGVGQALRTGSDGPWTAPLHAERVARQLRAVRNVMPDTLASSGAAAGPLAMGSLPYDPGSPGHLQVPRLLLGRAGDLCWASLTGEPDWARDNADKLRRSPTSTLESLLSYDGGKPAPEPAPDRFELSTTMAHKDWQEMVRRAVEDIGAGLLEKVVLARRVDVRTNRPLPLAEALGRLVALYPSCTVFHVEGFLGASPEVLVNRHGLEVLSHPLAGTIARSGDLVTDDALLEALMGSAKDRWEHQLVVDAIASVLRDVCDKVVVPEHPSVMALRNVSHLGTPVSGLLRCHDSARYDRSSPVGSHRDGVPSALALAARLQPTPAVGGQPTVGAISWQRANEGFDRGRYAGPVGWVDAAGDGEWVLGLRSASVEEDRASLYAGAGIVAGSDPAAELAETQLKLQALLAALVRP